MTKMTGGKTRKTVKAKTKARAKASRALPFLAVPASDPVVRLMTRIVLMDVPCHVCGTLLHVTKSEVEPPIRVTPARVEVAFDVSRYLQALLSSPRDAEAELEVPFGRQAASSVHLLSLRSDDTTAPIRRRKIRKPFFTPSELPELRGLSDRDGAEFLFPRLENRLSSQGAIPTGVLNLGKNAFVGSLLAFEEVSAPMRSVAASVPKMMGMTDRTDDVLPTEATGVVPKTFGWASGVPKNLPIVEDVSEPEEPALAKVAGVSVPAIRSKESFLERWELLHEGIMHALRVPSAALRMATSFAVLAAVMVVAPVGAVELVNKGAAVKDAVFMNGKNGLASLVSAASSAKGQDLEAAAREFGQAKVSFSDAKKNLSGAAGALKTIASALPFVGDKVKGPDKLLEAADRLASAGQELAEGLAGADVHAGTLSSLAAISGAARKALPDIDAASDALSEVDPSALPAEYGEAILTLKASVTTARETLDGLPERIDALSSVIGRDGIRRYLIVFQNSNELRATGGFAGSIAEATFDKGALVSVLVPAGGSYDLQGDLRAALLPPEPLRLVAGRWQFHDANWFPDFPTTAAKWNWFYQKSGGPSVDGVIAVTSDILPKLLELTGPISMPDYGRTMTSENVIDETQRIIELEHPVGDNEPKRVIGDLVTEVLKRLEALPPEKLLAAGEVLGESFRTKTVQAAFFESDLSVEVTKLGWSGELKTDAGDSVLVVDTNVGGGKTDHVVSKSMQVEAKLGADGSSYDTVTLAYGHGGLPNDKLTGETYRDFVRLYVPEGSTLVSATGDFMSPEASSFETADPTFKSDPAIAETIDGAKEGAGGTKIWNETGRTVFGNWLTLKPGERAIVRFVYRSGARGETRDSFEDTLTGTDFMTYRLRVEKQAGAERDVSVRISPPDGYAPAWQSSDLVNESEDATPLSTDRFYGAIYKRAK